jgi:hypothetical protein
MVDCQVRISQFISKICFYLCTLGFLPKATKGQHVQKMSVAEMRMLRWICGHTRKEQIRNDDIRDKLGVAQIQEKLVQHRL